LEVSSKCGFLSVRLKWGNVTVSVKRERNVTDQLNGMVDRKIHGLTEEKKTQHWCSKLVSTYHL
jgi:hypothetical protein